MKVKRKIGVFLVGFIGGLFLKSKLSNRGKNCPQQIHGYRKTSLISQSKLKGFRKISHDQMTGSYHADYKNFTGEEILFGSRNLQDSDRKLKCVYGIKTEGGMGTLFLQRGNHRANLSKDQNSVTFLCDPQSQYVIFKGVGFTGTLNLQINDVC